MRAFRRVLCGLALERSAGCEGLHLVRRVHGEAQTASEPREGSGEARAHAQGGQHPRGTVRQAHGGEGFGAHERTAEGLSCMQQPRLGRRHDTLEHQGPPGSARDEERQRFPPVSSRVPYQDA